MHELTYQSLISALPRMTVQPAPGSPLKMFATRPTAFVPPLLSADHENPLQASVLVVQAPAAVGKSTLASALSADAHLPVLDLSTVPVATGSLRSCVTDLGTEGHVAFQAGKVAFLIDALDEGRLLSGDPGFRAFFESAAPLVAGANSPRLILLGRPEAGQRVIDLLRETAPHLTIARLQLGFFDEEGARKLVRGYADYEATVAPADCKPYLTNGARASEAVIDEYLQAIERALALQKGDLWKNEQGRALAGYAPVLAALGGLLARMENFQSVAESLRREGRQEAWGVIEKVVGKLLTREKDKQCKKLVANLGVSDLPAEAYDENEQLALVTQLVLGRPRLGCGRVKFSESRHLDAYSAMIEQQLPEHPFVHEGAFRNSVLGSIALAAALHRGVLDESATDVLAPVSRQPFLWRSFLGRGIDTALFDGSCLGFLLESFWNDPVRAEGRVLIAQEEELISIAIPGVSDRLSVLPPITFYGELRDTDLNIPELEVRLVGRSLRGQGSQLTFGGVGGTAVTCGSLDFRTQALTIEGSVWLAADVVVQSPNQIRLDPKAKVGWGGSVGVSRPFRDHKSVLDDPHGNAGPLPGVQGFLAECARRNLPSTLVVLQDCGISPETLNGSLLWMKRNYDDVFRGFLKLLVAAGLATKKSKQTGGSEPLVTVHLKVSWRELSDECRRLVSDPKAATPHRDLLLGAMATLG